MGLFDFFKKSTGFNYVNSENENLHAISMRLRNSQEDTVFVVTSRICPVCSVYNRRTYSLFGRYKAFPLLPDFLQNKVCPNCGTHIGYSHYFPGVNGNLNNDIRFSNRPFVDSRTTEERNIWNKKIAQNKLNEKYEQDYAWICENLPDIAPKSFAGYKRMANASSKNYQKIVSTAKEKGYDI